MDLFASKKGDDSVNKKIVAIAFAMVILGSLGAALVIQSVSGA
jgi:hypothetical protein